MSSSPLWLCLTILGLASVGIISNVACIAILTLKKRSSMFHNLLKVFLYIHTKVSRHNGINSTFCLAVAFYL